MAFKSSALLFGLCASVASALKPLKVQGANFINSATNERFEIVGVAYQPGGSAGFGPGKDPLSDGAACLRDAAVMQQLGINTIRVYNLDPTVSHDECASIFNSIGVYMIVDVNSPLPGQALNAGDPAGSYNAAYLNRVFQVIEAFKGYDNLIGFFSGNEVINDDKSGNIDPPFIKAVTRDMKNYIAKHVSRQIPVGYSAADYRPSLFDQWQYLQCAPNGDQSDPARIDFFGLNSYSWCGGQSSYQISGYDVLTSAFTNTSIPIFFSEYGCNQPSPRVWDEVNTLHGPDMRAVLSGGLVYEYTQGENNYGLVQVNTDGTAKLLVDFVNLQEKMNKIDVGGLASVQSKATAQSAPSCDSGLITTSAFSKNFQLPPTPSDVQALIDNGVSGAVGGQLSPPSKTQPSVAVYKTDGTPIDNLAITPRQDDKCNTPSGANTNGGASLTGSGSSNNNNNNKMANNASPANLPVSTLAVSASPSAPAPAAASSTKAGAGARASVSFSVGLVGVIVGAGGVLVSCL